MSTTKLVIDYSYDFDLYGIVSPLKEYKLTWLLNKEFGWNLVKGKDISIDFINNGLLIISNFVQENDFSYFRLMRNQSVDYRDVKNPFLLPEMKQFDFLLQLEGETLDKLEETEVLKKIRNINGVTYTTKIEVENLKSKDNLLI